MLQQLDALCRHSKWPAKYESPDSVRAEDNWHQSQEGVVDESPAVDGNFVKAKQESQQRSQYCMETKEGRKSNEDSH